MDGVRTLRALLTHSDPWLASNVYARIAKTPVVSRLEKELFASPASERQHLSTVLELLIQWDVLLCREGTISPDQHRFKQTLYAEGFLEQRVFPILCEPAARGSVWDREQRGEG